MNNSLTKKYKILLVEDEESLAVGLEFNLTEDGYDVTLAKDGKEALDLFNSNEYDLIILDIMLPFYNGFEIAEKIRKKYQQMPILFLSARSGISDKIKGLELGADDYLTKPFHLNELLLRIKGMLKRKEWYKNLNSKNKFYKFGSNEINFENLECTNGKKNFRLTPFEATVLHYLINNKDRIVTRKELLEKVWHLDPEIETRTVDNFISRLRKYFETDPSDPKYITSIRSAGYMFKD